MDYNDMEEAFYKEKAKNAALEDTMKQVLGSLGELKESFLAMEMQQDTLVEINKAQEEELNSLKVECERLQKLSSEQITQLGVMQSEVSNQVVKVTDLENRLIITECDSAAAKTEAQNLNFQMTGLQTTVNGLTGLGNGDMVASQQFVDDAVRREGRRVFDSMMQEVPFAVEDALLDMKYPKKRKHDPEWDDLDAWDEDGYPKSKYV